MKYRFRLTFHHYKPGFFRIEDKFINFHINEDVEIGIYPRDSDTLINATKYHAECGNFDTEITARNVGEKLRESLKILNCVLNLGLLVPSTDGYSATVSYDIKSKCREQGRELFNTFIGLHVFPDDSKHFEFVMAGKGNLYPSDPLYVLNAIKKIWPNDFKFDERSKTAFEILNLSVQETSPKIRFLTTYLAIEQLIETKPRCEKAQQIIKGLINQVNQSDLKDDDKKSLFGSLVHLKEQSFSSAFSTFAKNVSAPTEINGKTVSKFVSECISLRNKIAHNVSSVPTEDLESHTKPLREMALGIIWSINHLPDISVFRPGDTVSLEKMEIRVM